MLFNLSIPFALLATLALSAPIDDTAALVSRNLEKRTDFLIDSSRGTIAANPSPELIAKSKVVVGCYLPSKNFTIYFTIATDCAKFSGTKVYPPPVAA